MASTTKKVVSKAVEVNDQTVIFSEKNLYFDGYGHIDQGFSVIDKVNLDIYLQSKFVREVSAVELAKYYSKNK
jgi:DNA-binding XRE family transcriptional regulator